MQDGIDDDAISLDLVVDREREALKWYSPDAITDPGKPIGVSVDAIERGLGGAQEFCAESTALAIAPAVRSGEVGFAIMRVYRDFSAPATFRNCVK